MKPTHSALPARIALLILSLLNALPLIEHDLLPATIAQLIHPILHQAIPLALFALVAGLLTIRRKRPLPAIGSYAPSAAAAGIGLFVLPVLLLQYAIQQLPPLTATALLALAPLFSVVLEPHLVPAPHPRSSSYALLAALIAFGGVLIVFPFALPSSTAAAFGLVSAIAAALSIGAANCLLVRATIYSSSPISSGFIATLTASIALIACSLVIPSAWHFATHPPAAAIVTLVFEITIELAALLLLFRLSARLSATSLASRTLWTILLAVLLEALLLQQTVTIPIATGLLLLASGSAVLLFSKADPSPANSLHLL